MSVDTSQQLGPKGMFFEGSDKLVDRIYTGLVLATTVVATVILSMLLFVTFLVVCAVGGAYEQFRVVTFHQIIPHRRRYANLACCIGGGLVVTAWLAPNVCWLWLWPFLLFYLEVQIRGAKHERSIWLATIGSGWSIGAPLGFIAAMANTPLGTTKVICYAAFIISSDVGGFAFGRTLGRRPWLGHCLGRFLMYKPVPPSPKKSIAGLIGCMMLPALVGSAMNSWAITTTAAVPLLGFGLGMLGQTGDTLASRPKRQQNFKNYASAIFKYLKGMGGLLDRIDSVLLTAPIAYTAFQFITVHEHHFALPTLHDVLRVIWHLM